jgi:hypothetical protein
MLPTAPFLLAAADAVSTGPLPANTVWVGLLALGCYSILLAADKAISIWKNVKKTPADHETYATKSEMREFESRVEGKLNRMDGSIATRLERMENTIGAELRSIHRSLGRLEGHNEEG